MDYNIYLNTYNLDKEQCEKLSQWSGTLIAKDIVKMFGGSTIYATIKNGEPYVYKVEDKIPQYHIREFEEIEEYQK